MTRLARRPFVAAIAALACLTATACSNDRSDPGVPAGSFKLVFFDSCEQALTGLRTAATSVVGPWGFAQGGVPFGGERDGRAVAPQPANAGAEALALPAPPAQAAGDAAKTGAGAPDYSGTNTHEAGVDEPDLVKTDGKRIITVSAGRLTVVDAATRRLVGAIDLGESMQGQDANLLLAGDHALVLGNQAAYRGVAVEDSAGNVAKPSDVVSGTSLILVDLTGPRVISRGRADGSIVDARQVGSVARIVVRSYPRLDFPMTDQGTDPERIAANKAIINASGIDDWLPRLEVTTAGRTTQTQVGCEAVSRPATYSGTNLLTVLSFDLDQDALSSGQPVSIVADGDTVYSNGPSLYVASNPAWRIMPMAAGNAESQPQQPRTEIYKFDTSSASEQPTLRRRRQRSGPRAQPVLHVRMGRSPSGGVHHGSSDGHGRPADAVELRRLRARAGRTTAGPGRRRGGPRQGRADLLGTFRRVGWVRCDVPADRPALHSRPW